MTRRGRKRHGSVRTLEFHGVLSVGARGLVSSKMFAIVDVFIYKKMYLGIKPLR